MLLIFLVLLRPPISRRSPLFVIICSTVFAILSVSVLIILIGLILVSYWSHIGLILVSLVALVSVSPSCWLWAMVQNLRSLSWRAHRPWGIPWHRPSLARRIAMRHMQCLLRSHAYAVRCRLPRGPAFSSSRNQGTAALSNPDERPSGDSKVISKYLQIKLHITLQGSCVVLKIEVAPKVVRKQRSESCIPVLRFEICRNKMNTLRQQQLQQSASQQCAHPHTHTKSVRHLI